MFQEFPYTDMHQLNLDWIIKIAKNFLDQYTHIQQLISDGETSLQNLTEEGQQQLQDKADALETALQAWYNEHSEDIANQLSSALSELNAWYNEHSEDIAGELASALADLNAWYTEHQGYLDVYLAASIAAFNTAAEQKGNETIASIPDDYTTLSNEVNNLYGTLSFTDGDYILDNIIRHSSPSYALSEFFPVNPGETIKCYTRLTVDSLQIAFFGEDKQTVLQAYNRTQATSVSQDGYGFTFILTAPANTRYFAFTSVIEGKPLCTFEWIGAIINIENSIDNMKNDIGKTFDISTIYPSGLIEGKFILGSTGAEAETPGFKCTPFIDLSFDDISPIRVKTTAYGASGCAFYNKNKEYLFGIDSSNVSQYGGESQTELQELTIPRSIIATAKYVRLSAYPNTASSASDLWVKGKTLAGAFVHISKLEKEMVIAQSLLPTTISESKVLVIGDSISTDYYGSYRKWVTDLILAGFLPEDTLNDSVHATGFVARTGGEANDFITRLQAVANPSQYDLVIVFGGINDFIQSIPMGQPTGTDYTVSFKPAVNEFFSYLIENFTQARLCVLLPLRTSSTGQNSVGEYQQAYGEYIHDVAKSYCMPVLNLTEESGFCPFIETFKNMWTLIPEGGAVGDGVHPNEEYEEKYLAPMIKNFLQGLM